MTVEVRIPTMLRPHTDGNALVRVDGATVNAVIRNIVTQFPGLESNLLDPEGGLHRFVNVYVNDEDIRYLEGVETVLDDGAEVTILPAVAGGCTQS